MTNRLALLAYWSVHQKLNHVSSVQLCCFVCALSIRWLAGYIAASLLLQFCLLHVCCHICAAYVCSGVMA